MVNINLILFECVCAAVFWQTQKSYFKPYANLRTLAEYWANFQLGRSRISIFTQNETKIAIRVTYCIKAIIVDYSNVVILLSMEDICTCRPHSFIKSDWQKKKKRTYCM